MPPSRALKPNVTDVFIRWIMNGMPQTAEEAAALYVSPPPEAEQLLRRKRLNQ